MGRGPESWCGECTKGRFQSPIDIPKSYFTLPLTEFDRQQKLDSPPVLDFLDKKLLLTQDLEAAEEGDAVKYLVTISGAVDATDLKITLQQGGLDRTFILDHILFHFGLGGGPKGSEHTFDAGQLAMEVQLFFKYERNQVFSEGLGRYNDVLAMAVLFEAKDNAAASSLIGGLVAEDSSSGRVNIEDVQLNSLIKADTFNEYFAYNGSMTVPTCAEEVRWIVSAKVHEVQAAQLRALSDKFPGTRYRPVQPMNGRPIVHPDAHMSATRAPTATPVVPPTATPAPVSSPGPGNTDNTATPPTPNQQGTNPIQPTPPTPPAQSSSAVALRPVAALSAVLVILMSQAL